MRIYSTEILDHINEEVELAGWADSRRDHGKLIFVDLRDKEGIVQLVFNKKSDEDLFKKTEELRSEWVISVKGKVASRPEDMKNPELKTGDYEVQVNKLEIITKSETLPFELSTDGYEVNEELRMKYRYLDLRRTRLKENIRKRDEILRFTRHFFNEEGFTEIETPIISKSTPEGARDYLVPSRQQKGRFYALPQSPQQYKQLLMIAGFEKYFQIARCFRDEDTRGDRQPEFTQIDVEMSFITQDDILNVIEKYLLELFRTIYPKKKVKLEKNGHIPRLFYADVMEKYKTDRPDLRDDKDDKNELAPAFVIDFPMFEKRADGSWDTAHHPFTKPNVENAEELIKKFKKDPSSITAIQYDAVLNGFEIFGGSIRIHNPELLSAIFEVLGHKKKDIEEKFGHLLEAFKYGVPPHGGVAAGFDRLVAILQEEPNIREVIAFPKTGDGRDLMMNAPSEVDKGQLSELGLKTIDKYGREKKN
jgi:aspartyl-tRNA synthetase